MRNKIRFFKQHTKETCGSACMLMLLDLYKKLKDPPYPTVRKELQLYSKLRSHVRYPGDAERFPGVNGAALANGLCDEGLSVRLVHASENMMENRDGYFPETLFADLYAEYRLEAEKHSGRVSVTKGTVISCDTLRQELDAGRQIILETIVPGDADGIHDHVLHWIVVYRYEKDMFYVCDPGYGKIILTAEALENYMDTPIGKIYLAVEEKTPEP